MAKKSVVSEMECTLKVVTTVANTKVIEHWYINGIEFKKESQGFDEDFTREDALKNLEKHGGTKEKFSAFMRRSLT